MGGSIPSPVEPIYPGRAESRDQEESPDWFADAPQSESEPQGSGDDAETPRVVAGEVVSNDEDDEDDGALDATPSLETLAAAEALLNAPPTFDSAAESEESEPAEESGEADSGAGGEASDGAGAAAGSTKAASASPDSTVTVVPGVPRYHRPDCILIRFMGEDDLETMSAESAADSGCTACRACQPDEESSAD
jgi:hypothetical protein